jgi:hypothetical protein
MKGHAAGAMLAVTPSSFAAPGMAPYAVYDVFSGTIWVDRAITTKLWSHVHVHYVVEKAILEFAERMSALLHKVMMGVCCTR